MAITPLTATWRGVIETNVSGASEALTDYDFTLTVDFQNQTLESASRTLTGLGTLNFANLRYDNAGLITGWVNITDRVSIDGVNIADQPKDYALTGLIGTDGAVGAFAGDGFSGGFIAAPGDKAGVITSTQFRDWRDESFGAVATTYAKGDKLTVRTKVSTTDARANFLTGGTFDQYLHRATSATVIAVTDITTLTLGDDYVDPEGYSVRLGGAITNGVSLFAVNFGASR